MTTSTIPYPPIVARDKWLAERKELLAHEKELTKHGDRVNAERRRLSMVKIDKVYVFDGSKGKQSSTTQAKHAVFGLRAWRVSTQITRISVSSPSWF